jgi:antitoxin (DNA-binding transcriptional repressor) of toxin-antitoxin stability system
MTTTIPITKARINLGSIVKRASVNGEYFILEKDGYPVAGIMGIDEFEDYLDANDPVIKKEIKESYEDYKVGRVRPARELLEELKKENNE